MHACTTRCHACCRHASLPGHMHLAASAIITIAFRLQYMNTQGLLFRDMSGMKHEAVLPAALQHVHTLEDALKAMDSLLQNFQLHRK